MCGIWKGGLALVRQHHGQDAAASAGEGVGDIVVLGDRRLGCHCKFFCETGRCESKGEEAQSEARKLNNVLQEGKEPKRLYYKSGIQRS
jgi:hypothetical protein